MKSLGERKVVFDTALELYKNLLGMYKTQYDKLKKTKKKKINTSSWKVLENLSIGLSLDEDEK